MRVWSGGEGKEWGGWGIVCLPKNCARFTLKSPKNVEIPTLFQ